MMKYLKYLNKKEDISFLSDKQLIEEFVILKHLREEVSYNNSPKWDKLIVEIDKRNLETGDKFGNWGSLF